MIFMMQCAHFKKAFFQMAILNSPFCEKLVNGNFKRINWKMNQGDVVCNKRIDFCAHSPFNFRLSDFSDLTVNNLFKNRNLQLKVLHN